jgi:acyl-CoA synthetase (AMP-forming)/AMP-acid ligase II
MNIAKRLVEESKNNPDNVAVVFPHYHSKKTNYTYSELTFKELDTRSNQFAIQLQKLGLKKGDRTLLFLRPSLDFHAMTFALFKIGLIPILIDPGMGKKNLLKCIQESKPIAMIAEKEVHYLSLLFPRIFKTIKYRVTTNSTLPLFKKMITISQMRREKIKIFKINDDVNPSDTAAILFTSGGTGTPKGVVYTHEIFNEQTDTLKETFHLSSKDIDMPGFPLFSLFTIAMGMKSCIPDMDPSKPSESDPKKLYQNIIDQKPSFVAGSPAIWDKLGDYCLEHKLTLPSIKYLVMFGAPVSVNMHRKFKNILTHGTTYTPYGATESLPVSNISGDYILQYTAKLSEKGHGICIGKPVHNIEVKIIKTIDGPIKHFNDVTLMPKFEPGEIIVRGKVVTKEYLDLPSKTLEAKIICDDGSFWHRMGDIGYLDEEGKIWFLGRKTHRVETIESKMYPIACEAIFNLHPLVKRSALVGIGKLGDQKPAIVIERKDGEYLLGKDRSIFESELLTLAKKFPHTENITKIYFSKKFPVDVRHNIKIDRTKLKEEIEKHEFNS